MATSKPRIQAYVEQYLFDCFKGEQESWGLTQSEALERILAERYGKVSPGATEPPVPYVGDRLTYLEKVVSAQLGFNEDTIYRLERLERLLTLNGKSPVNESELLDSEVESESSSKLPILDYLDNQESSHTDSSSLESESPDNSPSELPSSESVVSDSESLIGDSNNELPSDSPSSELIVSKSESSSSKSLLSEGELLKLTGQTKLQPAINLQEGKRIFISPNCNDTYRN